MTVKNILPDLNSLLNKAGYLKEAEIIKKIIFASERTYVIVGGDSIDKISGRDPQYAQKIIEENKKINPNFDPAKLSIGQKIYLPPPPFRPNQSMTYSSRLVNFVKNLEGGFHANPYMDSRGNLTIGYGHKIKSEDELDYPITEQVATQNLKLDLDRSAAFIKRNITVPLKQNQFDALVSIIFNIGTGAFFNSQLYKKIEKDQDIDSAGSLIYQFVSEGDTGSGIESRRIAEAELFESGTY